MTTETISIKLPQELHDALKETAKGLDRSKAWVVRQAVKAYVEHQVGELDGIPYVAIDNSPDMSKKHKALLKRLGIKG